jgi:hypothetical protein
MIRFNYQQQWRFILGICLIVLTASSGYSQTNNVVIAENPNSINNQLSAPSVFVFPPYIQTIGQAITEILKITEYSLSKNIPSEIQKILNKPLPMAHRRLEAMSVYAAIRTLTGAQLFMITPETKALSFTQRTRWL